MQQANFGRAGWVERAFGDAVVAVAAVAGIGAFKYTNPAVFLNTRGTVGAIGLSRAVFGAAAVGEIGVDDTLGAIGAATRRSAAGYACATDDFALFADI